MKKKRKYSYLWFVCLSLAIIRPGSKVEAQGIFTYQAKLDTVRADGFYEIVLTPELVAKCKPDMGDLRILSPDKRFVSYALKDSQEARVPAAAMTVPGSKMVQKDSNDKHSYISVTFPEAYAIDWVSLVIPSPVFFKRRLQVLAEGTNPGEWAIVADADIDPTKKLFRIPTVKTSRLRIDIANADNAPLETREVVCFQTSRYVVAYLRAGLSYQLYTGNSQAATPDYDLKYFIDSLKTTPRMLFTHSLQRIGSRDQPVVITPMETGKETTASKSSQAWILWCCLLAVLLFLVYFSVRMVKAIAKKDKYDRI